MPSRPIHFFRPSAISGPHARLTVSVVAALLTASALILTTPAHAGPVVKAYLSAPNTQFVPASISNPSTENFNAQTTGTKTATIATPFSSAIGAYTGTYAIVADNTYGTGTGNYFAIGAQSASATTVTLTFSSVVQYFGLSYNAADNNNGFTFYDESNNSLGRYSTAQLVSALKGGQGTVTALNGTVYNTSQFYGKPNGNGPGSANTGTNTGEAYGFLNFFVEGGTSGSSGVKRIVFDNSGSTGSGFESDNHTISTALQSAAGGNYVYVGATDTPEAGTLTLLFAGLPMLAGSIAVRKHKLRRAVKA